MKKTTSPKRHLFLTKNFIMMLVMLVVIIVAVSAWFTQYKTVTAEDITVKAVNTEIDIAYAVKTYNVKDEHGNLPNPNMPEGALLSDGPGEFTGVVQFDYPTDFGSFTKDCTGDGVDLIVPEFNITKDYESVRLHGGKDVNTNLSAATAKSNLEADQYVREHPGQEKPEYQYIQLEFYVRSKNKDLYLTPECKLVSDTEGSGTSLAAALNTGDSKRSAYGNFNVDGLVGATRVSLIAEACTTVNQSWETVNNKNVIASTNVSSKRAAEKQILWVPRPDVYLRVNENPGDISNWTLITGVTSSTPPITDQNRQIDIADINYNSNSYYRSVYSSSTPTGVELVEESPDSPGSKTKISSQFVTLNVGNGVSVPCLGSSVNITDFSYSNQLQTQRLVVDSKDLSVEDDYYVTKYTMKVWIEGTDVEARRAMDGGKFSIELYFA